MLLDALGQNNATVPTWALWLPQTITALATVIAAAGAAWLTQKYTLQINREQRQELNRQEWIKLHYETKKSAYLSFAEQVSKHTNQLERALYQHFIENTLQPGTRSYIDTAELDSAYFTALLHAGNNTTRDQLTKVHSLAYQTGWGIRNKDDVKNRVAQVYQENTNFLSQAQAELKQESGN